MPAMIGSSIGILTSSMSSYFVKRVSTGMFRALQGADIEIKVMEMQGKTDPEFYDFIENALAKEKFAGLVYGHVRLSANQLGRLRSKAIPVVSVASRMEGIDWVAVDEAKGALLATRYLLEKGHRRIGLISGPVQAVESRLREEGFNQALEEYGIRHGRELEVSLLNFSKEEGRKAANLLLDTAQPPTAIFCAAGDLAAMGVLAALQERRLAVPAYISVLGFDNLEFTQFVQPKLSTVNQPLEDMGYWAVKRLFSQIKNPYSTPSVNHVMEPELVLRGSVNGPRSATTDTEASIPSV